MMMIRFIIAVFFSVAVFSLSGCEKEEPNIEPLILGKWEISSVTIAYFIGNIQIDQQIETFAPGELVVELIEEGDGLLYEEGIQTGSFVWSLDGKIMTFPPPDMDPVEGKVKVTKTTLVVTWKEEVMEGNITTNLKYRIDAKKVI